MGAMAGGRTNMKSKLALLIAFFCVATSVPSLAREDHDTQNKVVREFEIRERGLGTLQVKITDAMEPAYQNFRMTLSVKCDSGEFMEWEKIIDEEAICDFTKHTYERKTKVLRVYFSTSEIAPGEAKCNSHWSQGFHLKKLCEAD